MERFVPIFSYIPKIPRQLNIISKLTSDVSIKVRPMHYRDKVDIKIKELKGLIVIKWSSSDYSFPWSSLGRKTRQ